MKKRFRGYDVKQVDELLSTLQNQNEALVAKIANLTMQLTAAESNNESETIIDDLNAQLSQINEKLDAAVQENINSEKKVQKLSLINEELNRQITELKDARDLDQKSSVKIGDICSRAYSDMEMVKRNVMEEMTQQIDTYAAEINDSNARMTEALEYIDNTYNTMLDAFAENLEDIFYKLKFIETGRLKIEKSLLPTKKIAEDLKAQVNDAVEKSIYAQKQEEAETLKKFGIEKKNTVLPVSETGPLDFLKQIRKSTASEVIEKKDKTNAEDKKEPQKTTDTVEQLQKELESRFVPSQKKEENNHSTKVIGIHTNITAEDILKNNIGNI